MFPLSHGYLPSHRFGGSASLRNAAVKRAFATKAWNRLIEYVLVEVPCSELARRLVLLDALA